MRYEKTLKPCNKADRYPRRNPRRWIRLSLVWLILIPLAMGGDRYGYSIISNCLCFDTNTAGRVIYVLKDYEIVIRQNELLRELDRTNAAILAQLTTRITNQAAAPGSKMDMPMVLRTGGICLAVGIVGGFVVGLLVGR